MADQRAEATPAESTRRALEVYVLAAWKQRGVEDVNPERDGVKARVAVYEVLDALRYNPAWLRSLGIGADEMSPSSRREVRARETVVDGADTSPGFDEGVH